MKCWDKRSKTASSPAFSRMGEILFVFLRLRQQFMKTNSQSSGWKPDSALVRRLLSRPLHGGLPSNVLPVGGTDMSAICEFKAVLISICIEIAGAGAGG
jgi:hypothetical protein